MANELLVSHNTGTTVYAVIRAPYGNYNDAFANAGNWFGITALAFGAFAGANWADYAIALTELGTTGLFEGDLPPEVAPETILEVYYLQQLGVAPLMTDTKIDGSLFEFKATWVAVSALTI